MGITFSDKIKLKIVESQNGYCLRAGCIEPIHSIHHKLKNTKVNRNSFPLFIHSPFNACGLCLSDHMNKAHEFVITPNEAMVYEEYLANLSEGRI